MIDDGCGIRKHEVDSLTEVVWRVSLSRVVVHVRQTQRYFRSGRHPLQQFRDNKQGEGAFVEVHQYSPPHAHPRVRRRFVDAVAELELRRRIGPV